MSNSTSSNTDSLNLGLLTAISIGGFTFLILLCSCYGILMRCSSDTMTPQAQQKTEPSHNPINIAVDEDPS